jgi:hypothetical protein
MLLPGMEEINGYLKKKKTFRRSLLDVIVCNKLSIELKNWPLYVHPGV